MKNSIKTTLALAALVAGGAGTANAEGWYGRADVGYGIGGEADVETAPRPMDLKSDMTQGVGLGYAFDSGLRFEGELSHRFNQITPDVGVVTDGDIHAWAGMLNGYYDFNSGGDVQPYLGVGVGVARLNGTANGPYAFNDTDTRLAFQGMAGLAFSLSEQLSLDVGYRYFVARNAEFGARTVDYDAQSVNVGLRYQFEAPAAAAPPPPPPPVAPPPAPPPVVAQAPACPTSEFVVYFEWDRANLNQAALETIDAAVARARQCNVSGTVVVGHTDTSGSPAYNAGLSERRASVVRDALVARGMGAGAITAEARGETALARATRDGVREPLNRRTAVTISFR
jgi:OmpA-OmpF porin, OOP family